MEQLSQEMLHAICIYVGLEATLTLCNVSSVLNKRISKDYYLWQTFAKQKGHKESEILSKQHFLFIVKDKIRQQLNVSGAWHSRAKTIWAMKRLN